MQLSTFRDAEDGCSEAIYSKSAMKWICGGSLGQAFEMNKGMTSFSTLQFNADDSAVTAVAVNEGKGLLAHSAGDSVTLRLLNDLESVKETLICRRSLPISHLQFSPDNNFL